MRQRLRRPLTTRAAELLIGALTVLRDAGHCPNAALDRSTLNGWQNVYAPRPDHQARDGPQAGKSLAEQALDEMRTAQGPRSHA